MNKKNFTYKKSGVNIDKADNFVDFIAKVSTNKKGKKSFQILEDLAPLVTSQKILKILKL